MEKYFNFKQCYTCTHLVYDMADRGYICPKTGREFSKKRETVAPTNCNHWRRD